MVKDSNSKSQYVYNCKGNKINYTLLKRGDLHLCKKGDHTEFWCSKCGCGVVILQTSMTNFLKMSRIVTIPIVLVLSSNNMQEYGESTVCSRETIGNVPVVWKPKRIQEHCLSVVESEYIALFIAMQLHINLQGFMFKIDEYFSLGVGVSISTISTVFEDNASVIAFATTCFP
eukprot:scaffold8902_cov131-Amphora_coffeaeformis.AAC.2